MSNMHLAEESHFHTQGLVFPLGNSWIKNHFFCKCYEYVKGQLLQLYNGVTAKKNDY